MNAIKCDRCGKIYGNKEEGAGVLAGIIPGMLENTNFRHDVERGKELCPACVNKLVEWYYSEIED